MIQALKLFLVIPFFLCDPSGYGVYHGLVNWHRVTNSSLVLVKGGPAAPLFVFRKLPYLLPAYSNFPLP